MADDIEFHGYAVYEKGTSLKKFSYKPRPLGPDDVEIKIAVCGICHSDVHQMTSGWGESIYPLLPGHEIVGKVTRKGANVSKFEIGDRVGLGPHCWGCLRSDCAECSVGKEPYCSEKRETYNDRFPDGTPTRGGYADYVRAHSHFVVRIPEALSDAGAAPLLCAGITVYSPLRNWKVKPGDKVGVVGIGGLGHLGVLFAKAIGAHVIALSSSEGKKKEAAQLGADEYWVTSDKELLKKNTKTLDFILATTSGNADWDSLIRLLKVDATLCLVGLPEEDLKLPAFALCGGRRSFSSSAVGGPAEIQEMLDFAAKHSPKIEAWVKVFPIEQVNAAVQDLVDGKPRFRNVLKIQDV
jgi:D-arabinose 1-dehydrogenase-like Zn-dependent alcohol dehydrogenase